MTCFNPKPAKWHYTKLINEKTGEIYKAKQLNFLKINEITDKTPEKENILMIPCGKCQGCIIDKANEWATRAMLEAQNWPKNSFLTLTYDNDHIPANRTLVKADLQKFWKRLRKTGENIRYMACGEYGPRTLRPHYHAIVYNYWPDDAKIYKDNIVGDKLYTSEKLNKIWSKGYVIVGNVTYESAAYVARYVFKKAYGLNKEWNLKHGRTPEFTLTSRRPGIALTSFKNQNIWQKIRRSDGVLLKTKTGVKLKKIPEYLKKKWRELGDREEYYNWSDAHAHALKTITRARTSDNYYQRLKKDVELMTEKFKRLDKRENF